MLDGYNATADCPLASEEMHLIELLTVHRFLLQFVVKTVKHQGSSAEYLNRMMKAFRTFCSERGLTEAAKGHEIGVKNPPACRAEQEKRRRSFPVQLRDKTIATS